LRYALACQPPLLRITRLACACLLAFGAIGCGPGAMPSSSPSATGALTAPERTHTAQASVYAARAVRYRRLSEENRQAATRLADDVRRQADIASATASVTTPRQAARADAAVAVDEATVAPDRVRTQRQAAADLADRLAATAQRASDFHAQKAAELAAVEAVGR
jgi:hypothetical protein